MMLLFSAVFLISAGVKAPGGSLSPDQLREQTVHVLSFAGETDTGSGTGTVLRGHDGSNYVFTAAHVISDTCDQRVVVEVHPLHSPVLVQLDAEIVWVDRSRDFALLRVTSPCTFARYAQIAPRQPAVGERVQHIGFMQGHALPHAYASGLVSCLGTTAAKWIKVGCDAANLMAMPGSSGGPVFDCRGRYAGILVGVTQFGAAFYVPLFQVDASLRESLLGLSF